MLGIYGGEVLLINYLLGTVAFARAINLATPINLLHLYQYFHIGLDYTFNSIEMLGYLS